MNEPVAAHDQATAHHYLMHYPEHPERTDDPHYVDFNAYRRRTKDTAVCQFAVDTGDSSECHGGLELHHTHVEFSLQNGVDLARLEHLYPGISNPDEVGAWIETAPNLTWLCLVPDVPVRMADGSEKALADVRVGDHVMTHDGTIQPVLAAFRKPYRGEVFRLGSTTLTPTHRVLTHRGWLTAAEVAHQVRMHGPNVVLLRCEEEQVLRGVVRPVPVDVMDALSREQAPSDHLLHDPSMLHDVTRASVDVDTEAHVASRSDLSTGAIGLLARETVQRRKSTGVRAVVDRLDVVAPDRDLSVAVAAFDHDARLNVPRGPLVYEHASATARAVSMGKRVDYQEMGTTDCALSFSQGSPGLYGGWYALREARSLTYTGYVHDITIANSHSFIAGGMVVHNCAGHHRGHGGVHCAASADYEASKWVRGLIT